MNACVREDTQGRAGGGGNSQLAPLEFLPPPEGFWTVVFYLSNVCKYYHLQTENNLNFLKNLCFAVVLSLLVYTHSK